MMADLAGVLLSYSWKTLLLVLLVFGTAPGLVLRLVVLAYPKDHPRRQELIAELYSVPRSERPVWVAEKVEVACCEGLPLRWRERRANRRANRPSAAKHKIAKWWGFPVMYTSSASLMLFVSSDLLGDARINAGINADVWSVALSVVLLLVPVVWVIAWFRRHQSLSRDDERV